MQRTITREILSVCPKVRDKSSDGRASKLPKFRTIYKSGGPYLEVHKGGSKGGNWEPFEHFFLAMTVQATKCKPTDSSQKLGLSQTLQWSNAA